VLGDRLQVLVARGLERHDLGVREELAPRRRRRVRDALHGGVELGGAPLLEEEGGGGVSDARAGEELERHGVQIDNSGLAEAARAAVALP
tara:strand:- start:354 stop:623 length:270 start_codon:yes stop_codon:yes gene_type:complete